MKIRTLTYHNIEQGTEEWMEIRCGRLGGTAAAALLVNGRNRLGIGAGLQTLIYKNAAALIVGDEGENHTNEWMVRGSELEADARMRYEQETFCEVEQVGYISNGDYLGYSPDGMVENDGLIEIKCPSAAEFVRFADTLEIDPAHMAQMQWGMWLTGRKWCDYIMYHPDFHPGDLLVIRVEPDEETHATYDEKVQVYISEMDRILAKIADRKQDA